MAISLSQPAIGSVGWSTSMNRNFREIQNAFNGVVGIGSLTGTGTGGQLRIQTPTGYADFGARDTTSFHIDTDRGQFNFNANVRVNSGIFDTVADNLTLQTNGTTRITILNSNGFVGIGTTSPGSLLHVNGAITFVTASKSASYTLTSSDSIIFVDASAGNVVLSLPAASSSTIGRVYTIFKIDSSGNTVSVSGSGSDTVNGSTSTSTRWKRIEAVGHTSSSWAAYLS